MIGFEANTVGFEALTVAGTAVGITAATRVNANGAHVQVETADVRMRSDGTAPTATVGTLLRAGRSY